MQNYFDSIGGFLIDVVHYIPDSAIAITEAEKYRLLNEQANGMRIIVRDGEVMSVDPMSLMTMQEQVANAKVVKIAEINAAFANAEQHPITVGNHSYKGGFESGLAIDAQRRMLVEYAIANPLAGISTVDFFDIHGTTITLPLNSDTEIDAIDVCLAVGQAAAANSFKCAQLIAAAMSATTIEEVNAIKW